jgi:diphthamide synthase (EF-2-diphthine--ammonia ligase)
MSIQKKIVKDKTLGFMANEAQANKIKKLAKKNGISVSNLLFQFVEKAYMEETKTKSF